jgi:hypothetical protein
MLSTRTELRTDRNTAFIPLIAGASMTWIPNMTLSGIIHRRSPNGDWEQMSINLRATPSFEALGRLFEAANPLTFWVQATRFMWMPWLLTAQTMMPSAGRPRTLPSAVDPQQKAPTASG